VLTCGGTRGQASPPYSYSPEEWSAARAAGDFEFDDAGLAAVLEDAREHGFTPAPVRVVPGADHGPLEAPVMAWFDSLASQKAGPTGSR
jgi:hypothetical protein